MLCRSVLLAAVFSVISVVDASHGHRILARSKHIRQRADVQVILDTGAHYDNTLEGLITPTPLISPPSAPSDDPTFLPQNAQKQNTQHSGGSSTASPDKNAACPSQPSRMLMMGYYPDWVGSTFPPERIDFKRYDWVDFAFAVPNAEFALVWDDMENGPSLLKRLVAAAHAAGSKVKLSIGGWTGSRHFSTAVASAENREAFARNIHAAYNMYDLDGIDIDWEYPGREGAGGNRVDSNDTANLLLFLQTLRAILPSTARISAAAQTTTFVDSQGQPMADVSEFAKVLDWVLLMNYDVWGSSSDPGPNAPLHDACGNSTQADASALAAYNAWTSAKFPACQMALGVPSYGYISTSKAERLRTRSRAHSLTEQRRQGNYVKLVDEDGGSDSQVQFREMVKQGALVRSLSEDGSGTTFEPSGGFEKFWDTCSGTPFLRSKSSGQVITYDDPKSLGMKAAFAKQVGMMGINMFDVHGDIDEWDLTDGIRQAVDLV